MKIEIWSDIVCPWCYIGKRRFERALARFDQRDQVEVVWRSYELDSSAPSIVDGSLDERLAEKYGVSVAEAAQMSARMTAEAAREGLTFNFDQARTGNTFDAHRLVQFAASRGLRDALLERLMQAYFSEGQPIGDQETLARLAGEVGLDADEARAALSSGAFAAEVQADERRALQLGIRGVPFFVIDEQYGISGAQQSELFLSALRQIWAESHPLNMIGSPGGEASCEDGSCLL